MLYEVCTRFASFDLGPESVSDRMMTDIYEHLIQRYGEEISQDAEDFMTPKDVARLATFRGRTWPDFESFKADLDAYVVHWNTRRRQAKLKGLTPEGFRNQSLAA